MGKHELKMEHALKLDKQKSDLNKDGKLSSYEAKRGQAIADAMKMAGSKGEFYMKPGHSSSKSMSELNMSNRDALMMEALYTHGPTGEPHEVPSYETTDVNANSSVSGSGSSSAGTGVNYKDAYKGADKTKYPTFEQFKEAATSYNQKKNTKKVSNNIETKTTTTQLGDKSAADIKIEGLTAEQNRTNKANAYKEYALNEAKIDSAAVTNKKMDKLPYKDQLNPTSQGYIDAVFSGNRAGRKTLTDSGAYNTNEISKHFTKGGIKTDKRHFEDQTNFGIINQNIAGKGPFSSQNSKQDDYDSIIKNTNPGQSGSFGDGNPTQQKAVTEFTKKNRKRGDVYMNMTPLKMSYQKQSKK